MLGNLGENLTNTMKKLAGMSVIDKKVVKEVVKDIQRALIQSDVNIQLVLKLSKKIEDRALNEEPPKGITPREHVIRIIYEEMVELLGSEAQELKIDAKPFKILFLGLQGSGKTTTIGKLCYYLQKKGFSPAIVCTDTWRPAAYEQLKQLTDEMQIQLYGDPENKDALDLAEKGLKKFKNQKIIIFDTAGRHSNEADLIEEMNRLDKIIEPNESILVIDGTIGQQAGEQAKAFSEATDIGSIIITKLDGTAKGGGALSTLKDMQNQFEMMNSMGPMNKVMNMIPGLSGKIPKEASQMTEDTIEHFKVIMSSMTDEEMENPKIIKHSRIQRISRGAGVSESDVKDLLKYYNNTKKAMKGISRRGMGGGAMNRLMGQFMNR